MSLVKRIDLLCNEHDTTFAEIERKIGLSNGSIRRWDTNTPSTDKVEKVADYFDVSTDYLLGRTAFKNTNELFEHWGRKGMHFKPTFDFGGLLQTKREELNISQEEVAKKLNMTVEDVDGIEEGMLPINSELAEKFTKALGTTVEELFEQNRFWTTYEEPSTIAAHLPEGVELTEEEQNDLEDYIQFILSRRKK